MLKYKINLDLIKAKRKEKGFTIDDMADSLGFKNGANYYKYEAGSQRFRAEMLPVLSEKLGISISNFFTPKLPDTETKNK